MSLTAPVAIVGASFGGLACGQALAERGFPATIIERKSEAGEKPHTTGILVREVVDELDWLGPLPERVARRIDGVRLYAPNMRSVDLSAPGYYFLATDTPALMRLLARRCEEAGARIQYGAVFTGGKATANGYALEDGSEACYLVGADGPKSHVAKTLALGENRRFIFGVEHEYESVDFDACDRLHCFIDRRLAPGYIGWLVSGVGVTQVGLARRFGEGSAAAAKSAMEAFLCKIAPIADFRHRAPTNVRAGLIPCGGLVSPLAAPRALLVGDAAGMVSPVTAGGIHTALRHGRAAGMAIADFLAGRGDDPAIWLPQSYPRFRMKRALRWAYDNFQSDTAFNLLLRSSAMRAAASIVFFHRMRAK
ncbi:NAD(P)/FAD-dependent oxidoreductase [Methylocystis sp. 9N]|uniref:NAD(P)/FAD-dependent oxidoreductase n=1 Tax=Methylocystis borbori TaxID=3118750 RepID=A0ABU7XJ71_9HYPH